LRSLVATRRSTPTSTDGSSCAPCAAQEVRPQGFREDGLAVLDRSTDAATRQDAAAATALFAPEPDTLLVGLAVGETARGIEAPRTFSEAATRWSVVFTWDWRTASAAGDVGWLMAEGRCRGAFEGRAFDVPYRLSLVLQRRGGVWLIRQFHGSEPSTTGQEQAG
jgi:ketosteroid isomerase-like protein